ncbi:MAG: hypothetical protein E7231_05985 [Cellulosilyticum sp.]|nr:hypothetical protein [Cellulosilyticum sp.]
MFNKVKEGVGLAIQDIIAFVQWLWEMIQPILGIIIEYIKICCSAWIGAFEGILTGVGDIINGVVEILGGIIDFIVGVFTGNWQLAWEGVVCIFSGLFEGIKISNMTVRKESDIDQIANALYNKLKKQAFNMA